MTTRPETPPPTPEEQEALKHVHGAYDQEVALWHLRDHPLQPGYTRIYGDHTGRWFDDVSPADMEASRNDPLLQELNKAVQEEINREIVRDLGFKL